MSHFAALFDDAADVLDGEFGDTAIITPMAGGKVSAARPDQSRAVRTVVGTYVATSIEARLFQARRAGTTAIGPTEVQGVRRTFELRPAVVAAIGWRVAEGDRVAIPGHVAPNSFVVTKVEPDDLGAVLLSLALETDAP